MSKKNINTSFSVADIMDLGSAAPTAEVPKPQILIVDTAPVQTTLADEFPSGTTTTKNDTADTVKKERPKWMQWAADHKAILFCLGAAVVLWVGFKKGFINWN